MSSASERKDHPSLAISVDHLPSSSPFPSPSSSFIPPPVPGAHEFALVQPYKRSKAKTSPLPENTPLMSSADDPVLGLANDMPSVSIPSPSELGVDADATMSFTGSSPVTPRPNSTMLFKGQPPAPADLQSQLTSSPAGSERPPASALPNARSSASLASSRPAPPSPVQSRRTSAALSRHSSTRSRPASTQPQPQPQPRRVSKTPSFASAEQAPPEPTTPTKPKRRSLLVKIRDFAFAPSDDRHAGLGPDAPRPNRRLQRPLSTWSTSSGVSDDDDDGDGQRTSGWGGFRWGGLTGWFGGGGGGGGGAGGKGWDSADAGPSQGDFERNFVATPEGEREDPYAQWQADGEDESEWDDEEGAESAQPDGPLLPGLYRALFGFEPEGTAEMHLEEDQIVRVVGRGGGVGWAIVERKEGGGHALVPEGYLEPYQLDGGESEE